VKIEGDNTRAKKRHNKLLRHDAAPAGRSLADWIRDAESERPEGDRRKKGVVHVYSDLAERCLPALKSIIPNESNGQSSTSERIRDELDKLWVDIEFWRLVSNSHKLPSKSEIAKCSDRVEKWKLISSRGADGVLLRWHIESKHGLFLPEFPPEVWKELVTAKMERTKLFEIFCQQEWRWLRDHSLFF